MGGGIPEGEAPFRELCGRGNSITQDISYKKYPQLLDYETQKVHMKDVIYLSSILYHFLLTKEMLETDLSDAGNTIRFSDGVVSVYDRKTDHLKVTWNDIADRRG